MSVELPPDFAELERSLVASRVPIPEALEARVLTAARRAVALERAAHRGHFWFAASVALAVALLVNLSDSAAHAELRPASQQPSGAAWCAWEAVRGRASGACARISAEASPRKD